MLGLPEMFKTKHVSCKFRYGQSPKITASFQTHVLRGLREGGREIVCVRACVCVCVCVRERERERET